MRDRLTDHGLVGAAVVVAGSILNLVLSCRVIGLGGERTLLAEIMRVIPALTATIVETDRNLPARHVYRDNGFTHQGQGSWTWSRAEQEAA